MVGIKNFNKGGKKCSQLSREYYIHLYKSAQKNPAISADILK